MPSLRHQAAALLATWATVSCLSTWKDSSDFDTSAYILDTAAVNDMSNCPSASGFPVRMNVLGGRDHIAYIDPTIGTSQTGSQYYYNLGRPGALEGWNIYTTGPEDYELTGGPDLNVACTEDGYIATGGELYFGLRFWSTDDDDYVGLTSTFDPPMLILPAEPAIGVSWDISSTRTFESYTGYVWSDLYEDHREIVGQETLELTIDLDLTEVVAWRVETSHGQTLYYADNYGLVMADDRVVTGSYYDPSED